MSAGSDLDTYGKRLKAARKAARMGQVALGKLAGAHQTTISDLESDLQDGSVYTAQLAHHLGVEAYWLATGKGARRKAEASLDVELLQDVLAGVELGAAGRKESPERKAKIAAALYQIHLRSETKPEPSEILTLLRSMGR